MRILITGATGFVGQHLLPLLARHDVIAIARNPGKLSDTLPNVSTIPMDLSQGLDVASLPEQADAIIYLAQSEHYRDFPIGADDVFQINVKVPVEFMDWAAGAGVKRAVFASSGTVYEPFDGPMHEGAAVSPTGYYGATKLACESLTLAYQSLFAVSHLRLFFVYGPGQGNSMISRVMTNISQGRPVLLPPKGDGLKFAPTYVSDAADVIHRACEDGWRGVWNVASPHAVNMREFADAVFKVTGRPTLIERSKSVASASIVPDVSKLAEAVDISRFVTVKDGAALTFHAGAVQI